jgi:beta-lactamase regulating signal transducer with metallopeptidase domain
VIRALGARPSVTAEAEAIGGELAASGSRVERPRRTYIMEPYARPANRDRTIPAAVIVAVLFVAILVAALIWLAAS